MKKKVTAKPLLTEDTSKTILTETKAPFIFKPTKPASLAESSDGKGKVLVVEGIFGRINAKNENNRRYPKSVWERNLQENSSFMSRLKNRSILGELEHPESGNTHLERVSHLLSKVWLESIGAGNAFGVEPGEYVMGRMEILPTPRGQILRALYEAKVSVGVSSRGRGGVTTTEGVDVVQDDYELDTFDAVYMPSVKEARPRAMTEAEESDPTAGLPMASEQSMDGAPVEPSQEVPAETTPNANWQEDAGKVIRAMQDTLSRAEVDDVSSMLATQVKGLDIVDELASYNDEEAVKLRSQAQILVRTLTARIADVAGGKKPKSEKSEKKDKKDDKKEESVAKPARLVECGFTDGETVVVAKQALLDQKPCGNIVKYLEGIDKSDVNVRLAAHGNMGCVVQLIEPAYMGHEFFVEYKNVRKNSTVEGTKRTNIDQLKESSDMKPEVLIASLVKRNKALREEIEALKKAKPIAEGMVPQARYDAAKKLIEGLVGRVKSTKAVASKNESRLMASVKLIKGLVEAAKAKKPVVESKAPVTEAKAEAPKAEAKPEVKESAASDEMRKKLVAEAKKVEGKVVAEAKETPSLMSAVARRFSK